MTASWPEASDLVQATLEFLDNEARPAIADPATGFKLRIAMNVLQIVERELRLGPAADAAARAALGEFLDSGDAALPTLVAGLCKRIRAGEYDADETVLLDLLEPLILGQVAIDNPRYSTFRALQSERGST